MPAQNGAVTRRARAYQARVRARRARSDPHPVQMGEVFPDGPVDRSPVDRTAAAPSAAPWAPPVPAPLLAPVEVVDGTAFTVRPVSGAAAVKTYTCPGCLQVIGPRVPHIVAWPNHRGLDGSDGLSTRRHWHRHCWASHVRAHGGRW